MTSQTSKERLAKKTKALGLGLLVAGMMATSLMLASNPAHAAFPGKNGKIAFASDRTTGAGVDNPEGDLEIFTINPDGTGLRQLTKNASVDLDPAYSANGKRIAFGTDRTGNSEVFAMNADGSSQINLTKNVADDSDPTFSPDGQKIAFVSDRAGSAEIFSMGSDGSTPTNLTNNAASDRDPTFSPNGQKIAFHSTRAGDSDIFLMGPDGSNPTDLTGLTAFDFDPAFSPDGQKVAFTSDRDGSLDVFVINTDGSSRTRLTSDPASDRDPAFSPDGMKIAFASGRFGNNEVFVMGSDGSNQADLTNLAAARDEKPDWQPNLKPATFTVTTNSDPGDGTCDATTCALRDALIAANASPGADTIAFDIPGSGVHTITPDSDLPTVTDPVTIDGYTQPGSSPNTKAVGDNAVFKVEINGATSGNGLTIAASNVTVRGLVINNFGDGIVVFDGANTKIEGNFIGTDPSGVQDAGNGDGVGIIGDAEAVTVGGVTPADRNVISGNTRDGVLIFSRASEAHNVLGNYIGTTRSGTVALANGLQGVNIAGDSFTSVGDGTTGGANTIAFNGANGVRIAAGAGDAFSNRVLGNSIFSNGALGIDLADDGVTPNDPGDADTGPNDLQNFPVLTSAKTASAKTTINGKLNSTANKTFNVQFFSNPSGNEGEKFIGQKSVTTDGTGQVTFAFKPASAVAAGQRITATATSPDLDTSEFSAPRTVASSTAAPNTIKVSGPSGTTTSTSATFRFYSPERGAKFECSLDGKAYSGCSSPKTIHGLSDGDHTYRVRAAKDAEGNVDATPATWKWEVDRG